jgi:hypothetical protein
MYSSQDKMCLILAFIKSFTTVVTPKNMKLHVSLAKSFHPVENVLILGLF